MKHETDPGKLHFENSEYFIRNQISLTEKSLLITVLCIVCI